MADQVLKVTLSKGGKTTDALFSIADYQIEITRNFVAIFAHNAGLLAEYGLSPSDAEAQRTLYPPDVNSVEAVITECGRSIDAATLEES